MNGLTCSVLLYENDPCKDHSSCQGVPDLGESQCLDVNYHSSVWIGVIITLCGATITNLGLNLQKYALRKRIEKREEADLIERRSSRIWSEHSTVMDNPSRSRVWHGPGGVLRTLRAKLDERHRKASNHLGSETTAAPLGDPVSDSTSSSTELNFDGNVFVQSLDMGGTDNSAVDPVQQIVSHAIAAVDEAELLSEQAKSVAEIETASETVTAASAGVQASSTSAVAISESDTTESTVVSGLGPRKQSIQRSSSAATLPASINTGNFPASQRKIDTAPSSPTRFSPKRQLQSAMKRNSSYADSLPTRHSVAGEYANHVPPSPTRASVILPDDAGASSHTIVLSPSRSSLERIREADMRPRKSVDFAMEDDPVDGLPVPVSRPSSAPIKGHNKSVSMSAPASPLQPPFSVARPAPRFVEVPGVGTVEYRVERPLPIARPATDPNLSRGLHGGSSGTGGQPMLHRARSTPQGLWRGGLQDAYDMSVDLPDGGRLRISISEERRGRPLSIAEMRENMTKEEVEQVEAKRLVSSLDLKDLIRNPIWVIGLAVFIFANVLNFIALNFAPQSLTAPLGAISLVTNVIVAPLMNKEKFTWRDIVGVALIVAGSVLVVVFAGTTYGDYPLCVLIALFSEPGTIALLTIIGAGVISLYFFIRIVEANIEGHCTIPDDSASVFEDPSELQSVQATSPEPKRSPEMSPGVHDSRKGMGSVARFWKGVFGKRRAGSNTTATENSSTESVPAAAEGIEVTRTSTTKGDLSSIAQTSVITSSSPELLPEATTATPGSRDRVVSTVTSFSGSMNGKMTFARLVRRLKRRWTNLRLIPRLRHDLPMNHVVVRLFLPFAYASLGGLMGTLTVLFAKSTIYLLTLSIFNHYNQYNNVFAWFITAVTVITAVSQVYWINMGLQRYDALLQIPVYFTVWTLFDVVGGGIYFSEFQSFNVTKAIGFTLGVLVIFSGVGVLTDRLKRLQDADDELERARQGK
ncbi:NIPA-like protein 3 [Gonapodya sp. JEL0774]|nr:NIPA-like protein 3 [Gonapodya sp. JEL0774]